MHIWLSTTERSEWVSKRRATMANGLGSARSTARAKAPVNAGIIGFYQRPRTLWGDDFSDSILCLLATS